MSGANNLENDAKIETVDWGELAAPKETIDIKIEVEKEPDINEILKRDYENNDTFVNLRDCCSVSRHLQRLIKSSPDKKNKKMHHNMQMTSDNDATVGGKPTKADEMTGIGLDATTITFVKSCLTWLGDVTEFFSKQFNQTIEPHVYSGERMENIPRSQYKFCAYKTGCKFYYGKNSKGCNNQHYPYNNLNADIKTLLKHLEVNGDMSVINQIEICINTIYYVFHHMCTEYSIWRSIQNSKPAVEEGWSVVTSKKKTKKDKLIKV